MSKKLKRGRLEPFKPQPAICPRLLATEKKLNAYRRAFSVMRIINIIFTVGIAVMTAIIIWRYAL